MNCFRLALLAGLVAFQTEASWSFEDPVSDAPNEVDRLRSQLKNDDRQIRGNAIGALGKLGEQAAPAADLLVEQFADSKEHVTVGRISTSLAGHAESALIQIGQKAVPALVAGLNHQNVEVRSRSALVLGQIGKVPSAEAIDRLIEMLGDADYRIAGNASSALKKFGEPVLKPLLAVLNDGLELPPPEKPWKDGEQPDPDDPLTLARKKRNYAVGVLGNLGDPRVIVTLLDAHDTKDLLLRRWVEHALQALRTEECQRVYSQPEVVARLLEASGTDDRRTRFAMADVLQQVEKDARGPLLAALNDPDRRVRTTVFEACWRMRDDDRAASVAVSQLSSIKKDDLLTNDLIAQERRAMLRVIGIHATKLSATDQLVPAIVARLEDPSSGVRNTAAFTITRLSREGQADPRIATALLHALSTKTDVNTRMAVIYAIGESRTQQATLPLANLLNQERLFETSSDTPRAELTPEQVSEQDNRLRKQICTALIALNDARAIPALRLRRSLNEPHVIEALGKLGDHDAIPELLKQLESKSFELRLAAAKALQGTPDRRSIKPLTTALHRELRNEFRYRSRSDRNNIREEIATALAATGEPEAAKALVDALSYTQRQLFGFDEWDDHRPELDQRAARNPVGRAIALRMGVAAIRPLIAELTRPHWIAGVQSDASRNESGSTARSREASAWALETILSEEFGYGSVHYKDAEPAFLACLKIDKEPAVQLHAARALGHMKSKQAIPDLVRIMQAAASSTSKITDKDIAGDAANDPNIVFSESNVSSQQLDTIELARHVIQSLSWIEAPDAADNFEPLLTHGVADIRKAAIFAIVSAKHERAFKLIAPLLNDSAASVRQTAARQLGFIGDGRAVPLLIQLIETESSQPKPPPRRLGGYRLSGPYSDPRLQTIGLAAQSLGMLSDPQAADVLATLTKSETADIRIRATIALTQLHDERGSAALREIMSSDDAKLRERAASHAALITRFASNGYCPKLTLASSRAILREVAEQDDSSRVRSNATRALALADEDNDSIEWLLQQSTSKTESVRIAALRALLKTPHGSRFEILRQFLKDASPTGRSIAVSETAQLYNDEPPGDGAPSITESIAAITPLLEDKEEQVRQSVLRAILKLAVRAGELNGRTKERIKQVATSDPSAKVRHSAKGIASLY